MMEIYVNYGIPIVHPNSIYVHYYVREMSTHIQFGEHWKEFRDLFRELIIALDESNKPLIYIKFSQVICPII
jgi:hypothetical protein